MSGDTNYWQKRSARHSRRALLRGLALGAAGLSSAALLACGTTKKPSAAPGSGSASGNGQPQAGGTFNTYVAANLGGLDPMVGASQSAGIVTGNTYTGLFRYKTSTDPRAFLNLDPENSLGVSMESPDAVTWTVKLRPDAVFHDIAPVNGHPVTAEDVKATFQRAFSTPNNTSVSLINMVDPNQITTPDATTAVFKLKNAFGPFHLTLAGSGGIMPREALAGAYDPGKVVIGAGPFVQDAYTPDVSISLKKHPHWFEQGQPYVDSILAAIVADPAQQLAQFTAGHIDSLRPAPADLPAARQQNPKATVLGVPSDHSWVYVGHMDRPSTPFYDLSVRKALSLAMDRPTLAKAIFGSDYSDNGVLPAVLGNSALPPEQLGDASQWYKYDPGEAKKLVDATPAAKQLKRLMYPVPTYGAQFEKLFQAVVSMLNAVGFQMQAVPIDYNKDFVGGGKGALFGNYPDDSLVASRQGAHNDAGSTLLYNFQSNNDHNLPKVSDPQLDAMMNQMNTILDESAHLKAVLDIQRYAARQIYVISLPSEYAYTVVQPWVQNYQYSGPTEGEKTTARVWVTRPA